MKKILVGVFILLLGVSVLLVTNNTEDVTVWEGGTEVSCCNRGYCFTLVNDVCTEQLWKRAVCTKFGYCLDNVTELEDVEGVITE